MGTVASITQELEYWQRLTQLEAGRAATLRATAQGQPIEAILNLLCTTSEQFNPAMKTSVLALNAEAGTLHPTASISLPQSYCDALDGVHIGIGVGSCGTAAFSKKRVIVEDINTHPHWAQYKQLALGAGLQACWSEPIIGSEGQVYGTFAIYYDHPKAPSEDDLKFIEASANLAAIVFESNANREQLQEANRQLTQTVDARTEELKQLNQELSEVVKQQQASVDSQFAEQKQNTIKNLLSGFAHELNTPLGVALTATSSSSQDINDLLTGIEKQTITQTLAINLLTSLKEKTELTQTNLFKTSELIEYFKQIDFGVDFQSEQSFDIAELLLELKQTYRNENGFDNIAIDASPNLCCPSKYALWQVLTALIENSLVHGFSNQKDGHISIGASASDSHIHITYHDDGKGITASDRERIFEPFYSPDKQKRQVGLGLNIVQNIVYNVFGGSIKLVDSPVGARFEICFPRSLQS